MKEILCPECKKGRLTTKYGDYRSSYLDRDENSHPLVVPRVTWLECDTCGEIVLDDLAMSVIEATRRRALGLLTPEEIRDLRLAAGRTQSSMSQVLGIGEKTYCRWESGTYVQSEASDRYLRLLIGNPENLRLLEQIAAEKHQREDERERGEDARNPFPYLENAAAMEQLGHAFTVLMSRGPLYHA